MTIVVTCKQMLSSVDGLDSALADSGKLCAKKDIIFAKLDQLLAKLAAQGASLNATDAESYKVLFFQTLISALHRYTLR